MAKKSKSSNDKTTLAIAGGIILAILVLLRTFALVKAASSEQNIIGAPNSFALWPAAALAVYALVRSKDIRVKYLAIIVLTVLAVSILVWLFGVTGANYLVPEI